MKKLIRKKYLAVLLAFMLLAIIAVPVLAQTYAFQIPQEIVHVYWEDDGTVSLTYTWVFYNETYADPIDFIDIGMPTPNFSIGRAYAEIDGVEITDISYSPYVDNGIALGLGSREIPAGKSGTVYFEISNISDVLYFDSGDDGYASAVFTPTWFGSEYVSGSTDMTVVYHLPPGVDPDAPRWHEAPDGFSDEPAAGHDENGRITYTWYNSSADASEQYYFGASFPSEFVPETTIATPTLWQNLGIDPDAIISGMCVCGFIGLFFGIPILSIRSANKRKLKYLPPKLALEGHGVKRGLTAVYAAILLEQPMDKIMTMILFAVIKKGAAKVTSRNPLELEITSPMPEGLRGYEIEFLKAMEESGKAARTRGLQKMMINLVKSVTKAMKGFSQKETKEYYEKIVEKAWSQVEASDTPEVKSETYDKVMEWTMLDDKYDERTRRVFQDTPVFVPMWWGNYHPTSGPRSSMPRKTSAPTSRPTPGGTKMPSLPGADFAASVVTGVETFAGSVVGNITDFTSGVTNKTNPIPKSTSTSSSGSWRSGGGGSSSCACACACAGCACACAGGGR